MPLVLAHGFVPSLWDLLIILGIAVGVCLLLGVATAAIVHRKTGRKRVWWLVPLFAAGWGALILTFAEGPDFVVHKAWAVWNWTAEALLDLLVSLLA